MNFRNIVAILPFALLAACGGSSSSQEAPTSAIETASPEAASSTEAALPVEATETATEAAAPATEETPAPVAAASPTASSAPAAETTPAATPVAAAKPPVAFAVCRACHSVEPGKNGVGPTLHGIYGSKAGEVPGYNFSPALAKSGIVWDRAALDKWLQGPMKMVPGTKMVIAVPDAAKREAIIDYLETLK